MTRLAFIVSHPIQYVAPLYQRLAKRGDLSIKVFFTWHAGEAPVIDRGFGTAVKWDIPLTDGYDFELVENTAAEPGTHHFLGLRNPGLVQQVKAWGPTAVHITGWAWLSHLQAILAFSRSGIPVVFRGDSHLLDRGGALSWAKRSLLRWLYSYVTAFLVVGTANRQYYRAFGVPEARLFPCPYGIDVGRFAEPNERLERAAQEWRAELALPETDLALIYAGKFERKKRPVELMRAIQKLDNPSLRLIMLGSGELNDEVKTIAAADPQRFRVLPFQNQSRMPLVYRLGDVFVLPSAYGETWGLAVNEAMACGRPVLVSNKVGCAADLVKCGTGWVFDSDDPKSLLRTLRTVVAKKETLADMGNRNRQSARLFDFERAEDALLSCLNRIEAL